VVTSKSLSSCTKSALQAIALKGQYEVSQGNTESLVDSLKSLGSNPSTGLIVAQVLLAAGQVKEALATLHQSTSGAATSTLMEIWLLQLQIYLKIDRLDLGQGILQQMKMRDEDSVLTQLAAVYLHLAAGSSAASEALHLLGMLSEQYGASPYLLNLVAAAHMLQGDYAAARAKLQECLAEANNTVIPQDTYANLVTCAVHLEAADVAATASWEAPLQMLQQAAPHHAMVAGYARVSAALDREAVKYKV
jgi:tetratricopeptide (TPR) repeat protein